MDLRSYLINLGHPKERVDPVINKLRSFFFKEALPPCPLVTAYLGKAFGVALDGDISPYRPAVETPEQDKKHHFTKESASACIGMLFHALGIYPKHQLSYCTSVLSKNGIQISDSLLLHSFILYKSAMFDITKNGNCSERASYLGLMLAPFVSSKLSIHVRCTPNHDQYYVHFSEVIDETRKTRDWAIDVLLDPLGMMPIDTFQFITSRYMKRETAIRSKASLTIPTVDTGDYQQLLKLKKLFEHDISSRIKAITPHQFSSAWSFIQKHIERYGHIEKLAPSADCKPVVEQHLESIQRPL